MAADPVGTTGSSGRSRRLLGKRPERPQSLVGATCEPAPPAVGAAPTGGGRRHPRGFLAALCTDPGSRRTPSVRSNGGAPRAVRDAGLKAGVLGALGVVQDQLHSLSETVATLAEQHSLEVARAVAALEKENEDLRVENGRLRLMGTFAPDGAVPRAKCAEGGLAAAFPPPPITPLEDSALVELRFDDEDTNGLVDSADRIPLRLRSRTGSYQSLQVTIIGARGLLSGQKILAGSASLDAYCVCEVKGKPLSRVQTRVIYGSVDPVWEQTCEIPEYFPGDSLEFAVWDKGRYKSDDLLGKATLLDLDIGDEGYDGELHLTESTGVKAFLRLKVVPLQGRNLGDIDLWPFWRTSMDPIFKADCIRESSVAPMINTMMGEMMERHTFVSHQRLLSVSQLSAARVSRSSRGEKHIKKDTRSFCQRAILVNTGSYSNLLWQLPGGLLICYDVVMIPMQSFSLPELPFFAVMSWISPIYWSCDLLHNFCVTYEEFGKVEDRPFKVAMQYAKTWLVPDATMVSLDWIMLVSGIAGVGSRSWRAAKVLRSFRVLRSAKVFRMVKEVLDRVQSQQIILAIRVCSLVVSVLLSTHYIACYWYAITGVDLPLQTTWVKQLDVDVRKVALLYLYSLQWVLAQSGLASATAIAPTNWLEYLFSLVVSTIWLVMLGGVFSQCTLWMMQMRDTSLDWERQEALVRRYLQENKISADMGNTVVRFFRLNSDKLMVKITDAEIPTFNDLPLHIRVELHRQIYMPVLKNHPAFGLLDDICMDSICHLAITDRHYLAGQKVFEKGEIATRMFFVQSGELRYYLNSSRDARVIGPGKWVGEAILWKRWTHVGWLIARTSCHLCEIDAAKFNAIMAESEQCDAELDEIRRYVQLVTAHYDVVEPVTDLWDDVIHLTTLIRRAPNSPSDTFLGTRLRQSRVLTEKIGERVTRIRSGVSVTNSGSSRDRAGTAQSSE